MKVFVILMLGIFSLTICTPAEAQLLKKLKKKVEQSVDRRLDRRMDETVEGTLDKTEGEIDNLGKKPSRTSSKDVNADANAQHPEGNLIDANYDFEPGGNTLFEIDFTNEQAGNFPRRLEFLEGNFEVVDWNGKRFGRAKDGKALFAIQLPENLPEMFTIQLKLHDPYWLNYASIATLPKLEKGDSYFSIYRRHGVGIYTVDGPSSTGNPKAIQEGVASIEIMMDGTYAKMFVDGERVANIPNANISRTDKLYFSLHAGKEPEDYIYITDIRVAGGGRTLYQTLEAEGRIAFNDIHFATGKAEILPESAETIEQIAKLLKDHQDLKLLIEGHTDNTGDFDANMELSKSRADAVKAQLISQHGITEGRLRSVGQGQTQPVDSNETEEGKAKNRRVEIVKI